MVNGADVVTDSYGGQSFHGGFHGSANGAEVHQQIVVDGVDLTAGGTLSNQDILNNLLANNNLVVDQ